MTLQQASSRPPSRQAVDTWQLEREPAYSPLGGGQAQKLQDPYVLGSLASAVTSCLIGFSNIPEGKPRPRES